MTAPYWREAAKRLDDVLSGLPGLDPFDLGDDPQATLRDYEGPPEVMTDKIRRGLDHFANLGPREFASIYAEWQKSKRETPKA